ncbi:hypothetical protein MBLNU457_4551t1 [Dothideomycetes sp. NU457]
MEEKPEAANITAYYGKLFELYSFADKIDDKACKNATMDRIMHLYQQWKQSGPGAANMDKVFNGTMDDCMLQKFLVDGAVYCSQTIRHLKPDEVARCPFFYAKIITKGYYHEVVNSTEPADDAAEPADESAQSVEEITKAVEDPKPAE